MAIGVLGSSGVCHLNVSIAMYDLMGSLYPRLISTPTIALTTALSGHEVITAQSVTSSGLITYSTKNQQTNAVLQTNKQIQMMQCQTDFYALDNANGAAYNYFDAAAMFGFAFTWVFALWYLSKNLGTIINAVKRF